MLDKSVPTFTRDLTNGCVVGPSKQMTPIVSVSVVVSTLYVVDLESERKKPGLWWDEDDNVGYVVSLNSRAIVY